MVPTFTTAAVHMNCIDCGVKGNEDGYGRSVRKVDGRPRNVLLHRWAYCQHHGLHIDDITGLVIRHTCDNPRCINPAHLIAGTQADNIADKVARGRQHRALSAEQAAEVRARYVPYKTSQATLATEFGVSVAAIQTALRGHTSTRFDDETVAAVRARHAEGWSCAHIARCLGTSPQRIHSVCTGRSYTKR